MSLSDRRCGRLAAGAGAISLLLAMLALTPGSARAQSDGDGGLRVVDRMTRPSDPMKRPMAVDEDRNLGFVTNFGANPKTVDLVDLERLTVIGGIPFPANATKGDVPERTLAIDRRRERLYRVGGYPSAAAAATACSEAANTNDMQVYDYRVGADGRRRFAYDFIGPMPCTGTAPFLGLTNAYYQSPTDPDGHADRLYVGGVSGSEGWRSQLRASPLPAVLGGTVEEDRGQALLVRQLFIRGDSLCGYDPNRVPRCLVPGPGRAQPVLEWEVDLRMAGCGRRERVASDLYEGFVARQGDEILAYCWDTRAHTALSVGAQGYLVKIPLSKDPTDGVMRPLTRGAAQRDPATGRLTNYVFRRVPTLAGDVTPILDPKSGRVMLVTADATNGNAVWVLDPATERFVGVITGGYGDQPKGNTAVGFDATRGRVYVLTRVGLLIAPIRVDPLPSGLIYPVLVNTEGKADFVTSDRISVAPKLGRLFVAMNDGPTAAAHHYEVLEDRVPDPPRVVPVDPDSLTSQVTEQDGKTASATSGQALASGVHVVNTGGLPRAVGQNDPTCIFHPPNFDNIGNDTQREAPDWELAPAVVGSCLSEMAVSPGHREGAAATTELQASTGGGSTARGAAFAFGSNDAGTDGDIRRPSDCAAAAPDQADQWGRRWPFPEGATTWANGGADRPLLSRDDTKKGHEATYNAGRDAFWDGVVGSDQFRKGQQDYRSGCNTVQDGFAEGSGQSPTGPVDLRSGTRGPDGKGSGVRAAACGDFGGAPAADTWPAQSAGAPQAGYPTSSVSCDASVPGARGDASAGALALPTAVDPQLRVARVSSKVTTVRTADEGQVTLAFASASGVQVGPLSIAEVRSLAITKAAGRKGSTSAILVREWCGLSVDGQAQQGCVDPTSQQAKDLLDEVSGALLQKVQLSVPEGSIQATPKGYQAVVTKSVGQRGADQTVNDDDSHTVSALQAVLYNDGPNGRSRFIVQLAGVHAESRYGIIELPNFSTGPDGFEPPSVEGDITPFEEPVAEVVDSGPPTGPAPVPDSFTPDTFTEEFGGPEEFVRFSAPPPRVATGPQVHADPLRRIVRVPVRVISDAINLLVQNPREAALLFVMWAMLAAPLYLGLRRRSFARALTA